MTYLRDKLGEISVNVRKSLMTLISQDKIAEFARKLAAVRVRDPTNPETCFELLRGEIEFEQKLLQDLSLRILGILYDGIKLHAIFRELISIEEFRIEHTHIVFTNRLFGTFDENDKRYHAKVSVYGFPSLISTTGIVEAPAKPKEYYVLKQQHVALGNLFLLEKLKEKFVGRFLDYDDERLTEVTKGYVMQALFYHIFGEPFCEDRKCRLFNSHWQKEMLGAQLKEPEFCGRHAKMLGELKRSN